MEDNKLLRLLHKDPNAGMEQLMNQYTGLVYAVVKSKLDDSYYVSSDIEDCVADVFSKFYAELSDYDPKISSIKTYLCVIARNASSHVTKRSMFPRDETSREAFPLTMNSHFCRLQMM